jgi:small conductance mechanosensitive channel
MLMKFEELVASSIFTKTILLIMKVIGGFIVVFILFKIINFICKKIKIRLEVNKKIDSTLLSFLSPLISKILKFFVIVGYVGFIGLETSSIAAGITSLGLAIGLAMQGALSNFAGGFIILAMRPFKVGDYIYIKDYNGSVESIDIFYTTLITPDYKLIKIPNGEVTNSIVVDTTSKKIRRVDFSVSFSYQINIGKVKMLIRKAVENLGVDLSKKEIFINVIDYKSNYLTIETRFWVYSKDYWNAYYKILDSLQVEFSNNGIDMSYSYMNVNLIDKNV